MKYTRTIPVLLIAAAAACSSESPAPPSSGGPNASLSPTHVARGQTTNEFALRTSMRQLWEDHVFWTRLYIIDAVSGLPDDETAVTAQRLMQNQIDIGNAIRPFYGVAAGEQLTALLHQHILGAVDVLNAALAHDDAAFAKANAAWYKNGDDIARFLATANPNWPLATMQAHMKRHLDLTLGEASARIAGNYADEVRAYDAVVDHILTLSDVLTNGIVAQNPGLVGPSPMPSPDEDLHVSMRKLWEDHVQWTRIYIVDQTASLPDTQFAAQRLLQNQVDIGNAVAPFYGQAAGAQLTNLLTTHITGAVTLLQAEEGGDARTIADATAAWYANGEDIAMFLAGANPHWPLNAAERHMKLHLDQTLAEASAHLQGKWSTDATDYDVVVNHIRAMADFLSDGIAAQFVNQVK